VNLINNCACAGHCRWAQLRIVGLAFTIREGDSAITDLAAGAGKIKRSVG